MYSLRALSPRRFLRRLRQDPDRDHHRRVRSSEGVSERQRGALARARRRAPAERGSIVQRPLSLMKWRANRRQSSAVSPVAQGKPGARDHTSTNSPSTPATSTGSSYSAENRGVSCALRLHRAVMRTRRPATVSASTVAEPICSSSRMFFQTFVGRSNIVRFLSVGLGVIERGFASANGVHLGDYRGRHGRGYSLSGSPSLTHRFPPLRPSLDARPIEVPSCDRSRLDPARRRRDTAPRARREDL